MLINFIQEGRCGYCKQCYKNIKKVNRDLFASKWFKIRCRQHVLINDVSSKDLPQVNHKKAYGEERVYLAYSKGLFKTSAFPY